MTRGHSLVFERLRVKVDGLVLVNTFAEIEFAPRLSNHSKCCDVV